jgi:glycosyltransferase involved in cell wall biosynthesis
MNRAQDSRKSVGVFMPFLSEIRGGPDVTAMWLIQALCTQYEVTLVTTSQFNLDFFNNFAGTRLKQDQFHIRRLRLLPVPKSLAMSAIQGPLFQRYARSCAREFEICISAMNLLDFAVPAVQFVSDFDWLPENGRAFKLPPAAAHSSRSVLRRIYHALSARIQARSGRDPLREDVLVSNSKWVESRLRAMGGESSVIYPPVPWSSQEVDWDTRRKDFVWFGRISPQKKVEDAIHIVAGLRNTGVDCCLHIAGMAVDKDYLTFIQALAKRMGDWVVLEGPLYGDKKAQFLAKFRYALHTRADEPFGITLVEVMKAGCIPFASDSCGSAEILNHPALLFSDEAQAVTKIRDLLSDSSLSLSVRAFLRHRAKLFSTDSFCESAVALISNVLERASSHSDARLP